MQRPRFMSCPVHASPTPPDAHHAHPAYHGCWAHSRSTYGHGGLQAQTPAAVWVVASFALMMVLAAAFAVIGSIATIAILDDVFEPPESEAPAAIAP